VRKDYDVDDVRIAAAIIRWHQRNSAARCSGARRRETIDVRTFSNNWFFAVGLASDGPSRNPSNAYIV